MQESRIRAWWPRSRKIAVCTEKLNKELDVANQQEFDIDPTNIKYRYWIDDFDLKMI
jgi:hypothetical protein